MGNLAKSLWQILSGECDQNVAFTDLVYILESLGFQKRIKASYHLFSKDNIDEIINIQPTDGKAKPYQVKQVRAVIVKYQLVGE
jgi:hypothetical protein